MPEVGHVRPFYEVQVKPTNRICDMERSDSNDTPS